MGYLEKPKSLDIGWDSKHCGYTMEFGGSWELMLGYYQYLPLKPISPRSSMSGTIRLIVNEANTAGDCQYGLNDTWDKVAGDIVANMVIMNIGFLLDDGSIDLSDIDDEGSVSFRSTEDAVRFDGQLIRFKPGPIWYRVKKQ